MQTSYINNEKRKNIEKTINAYFDGKIDLKEAVNKLIELTDLNNNRLNPFPNISCEGSQCCFNFLENIPEVKYIKDIITQHTNQEKGSELLNLYKFVIEENLKIKNI